MAAHQATFVLRTPVFAPSTRLRTGLGAARRLRVDREPVAITALDELAARFGLSAYDAAYLELALRRSLPLATLDDALLAAMAKAGAASAVLRA